MAWAEITTDEIHGDALLRRVTTHEDGAAILFLGQVRNHNDGRAVSGMEYQGYEVMAQSQLLEIAREAEERCGGGQVAAAHRLGTLTLGEVSVAIAVASPHRDRAYEASRYVIEEIKKRLPVWKREHYVDGNQTWLKGQTPPSEVSDNEDRAI